MKTNPNHSPLPTNPPPTNGLERYAKFLDKHSLIDDKAQILRIKRICDLIQFEIELVSAVGDVVDTYRGSETEIETLEEKQALMDEMSEELTFLQSTLEDAQNSLDMFVPETPEQWAKALQLTNKLRLAFGDNFKL
jgi:hypothetical protein